jgi:hypothetical protein
MTTKPNIQKITSAAPYEYIQEYQSIEQEYNKASSSEYTNIYQKIQGLDARVMNDLNALYNYEASSESKQNVYKKATTDYAEIYKSIYAKILIGGISMMLVAGYGIYYIWSVFSSTSKPVTVIR